MDKIHEISRRKYALQWAVHIEMFRGLLNELVHFPLMSFKPNRPLQAGSVSAKRLRRRARRGGPIGAKFRFPSRMAATPTRYSLFRRCTHSIKCRLTLRRLRLP